MAQRKLEVSFWNKDGRWHISERYSPSEQDRKRYPVSYPADDLGPFFRWSEQSFDTEREALDAIS